jgi:hypothetical protein
MLIGFLGRIGLAPDLTCLVVPDEEIGPFPEKE